MVVTSANGVELLLPGDVRSLHGVAVAAIGPATAQALRDRGIVPDVVPAEAVSESLLAALGDVGGRRVLVATAQGARDVLPDGLRERGAHVDVVHLYRTVPEPVDAAAVRSADLITFTSSSTVAEPGRRARRRRAHRLAGGLDRPRDERRAARARHRAGGRGRPAHGRRARRRGRAAAR